MVDSELEAANFVQSRFNAQYHNIINYYNIIVNYLLT